MFIRYNELNEVTFMHLMPELMLAEDKVSGIEVNSVIPQPEVQIGKDATLCIDLTTNTFYFKYVDRPLNQQELAQQQVDKLTSLESQNAQMLLALVNGGLM